MSARIPVRRLGQSCLAAVRPRSTYWINTNRAFGNFLKKSEKPKDGSKDIDLSNPLLDEYLAKRGGTKGEPPKRPVPKTGDLSPNSIFNKDYEIPGYQFGMDSAELEALKAANKARDDALQLQREKELHSLALDPLPKERREFERKLIIKSLQKQGRVTKKVHLMRTEREMTYKSQNVPTSVKKMVRLMHLIQGKTIEEALIQLRFSKKRIARDVIKGLQTARDEAIAARGMGLGAAADVRAAPSGRKSVKEGEEDPEENSNLYLADGTRRRQANKAKGTVIELKDGSRKVVTDPTEMYIHRAWATKGPETKSPEFRARGRANMLHHRSSKFNVHLKEEKTRMRISEEIQKKRANKPLWHPLPDRPVTAQRQYCLW
ncbi:ribosomal protein L22 [Bimuria novae-zelandiae CBS 107.79]|uniref:Ribosomal protein L22 n=1 Tax=Bimuria novae-zelandiae CBS 107.79 TaxID=1447943 RepID=A0A6A5UU76_9PLEO|nr:ribosomal protein L22 [Bimuria novae-zelandiae CBS 107.79]